MACPQHISAAFEPSRPLHISEQLDECSARAPDLVDQYQHVLSAVSELESVKEGFRRINEPGALNEYFFYHNGEHASKVMELSILIAIMEGFSFEETLRIGEAAAKHDIGKLLVDLGDEPSGARLAQEIIIDTSTLHLGSNKTLTDYVDEGNLEIPPFTRNEILLPYLSSIHDIVTIGTMIEDTMLRPPCGEPYSIEREQRTSLKIAKPLLDADMAGIGFPSFFSDARNLYCELSVIKGEQTLAEAKSYTMNTIESFLSDPKALPFLIFTESLFRRHDWHTDTARSLFEETKRENLAILSSAIISLK